MKKKKVAKAILLSLFILISIFFIIALYKSFRNGNQQIRWNSNTKYYANSNLTATIQVKDNKQNPLKSTVKVQLVDDNNKKVKKANAKYKQEAGEDINIQIPIPEVESGTYYLEAKVSSKKGTDTIRKTIQIIGKDHANINITFDKGIYKPGDEVKYRTLLTSKMSDKPIEEEVNISIYDGNDNRVYNETVKSSDFGIISGTFKLADEVNSGTYKLTASTKDLEISKQFQVSPYVIPKFETNIKLNQENYLVGEKAEATISSKYFFGEPVKNAAVKIYIDEKEVKTGTTNEAGEYKFEYEIKEAKKYAIRTEVIDSSNYFVEAAQSFVAGTDIFEIELLPENKDLISGMSNDIYVFTRKADGTPVKTYVTIACDKITRQVATDENGIGKFSMDITGSSNSRTVTPEPYYEEMYDISYREPNPTYGKTFHVTAEDMQKQKITKTIYLNVVNTNMLLKTDKAKYDIGEKVKLNVVSNLDAVANQIYAYKNDKLLKIISTDQNEIELDLDNNYGIIDIYASKLGNTSCKRTIFVSPNKTMEIKISTDKEEYKPGEEIKIGFEAKQNGEGKDTALLVSMLDEAVLNLAGNDLSIDNIKLALSDIHFSDELDAATLYASIIENKSDQTIMGLLLKQSAKDMRLDTKVFDNRVAKEDAIAVSIILGIIIGLSVLIYIMKKSIKTREILKHIVGVFGIYASLICLTGEFISYILEDILYGLSGSYSYEAFSIIVTLTILLLVTLILYILFLRKKKDIFFKTTIANIISLLVFIIIVVWIENSMIVPIFIGIVALLVIYLITAILKSKGALDAEMDGKHKKLKLMLVGITKYSIIGIISLLIGYFLYNMTYEESILIGGVLVQTYLYPFIMDVIKNRSGYKRILSIGTIAASVIATLIVLGIIGAVFNSINAPRAGAMGQSIGGGIYKNVYDSGPSGGSSWDVRTDFEGSVNSATGSVSKSNSIFDMLPEMSVAQNVREEANMSNVSEQLKQEVVEENVRNIFLESMCFIPELIAKDGKADIILKLSDNITTWNIQTVGNTKDGVIGYSSKQVKVFKEFFVDFELPKNLINGDVVSIPVTIYNYTDKMLDANIHVADPELLKEDKCFEVIENGSMTIKVEAKSTKMVYVSLKMIKAGTQRLRIETKVGDLSDIVEKTIEITPNGYKKEKLVSSGTFEKLLEQDILYLEDIVGDSTRKLTVKLYETPMAQVVNGLENIFRMPTGCFEQISSSLYPNGLALKYMKDNNLIDEQLSQRVTSYISSGYQKLLTYEVLSERGGFSLYGDNPAETVLTSYGLMELKDLSKAYPVDEKVLTRMQEFLYNKQNADGSFKITGSHLGGASSNNNLSLNAYIIWALTESFPNDARLNRSIDYLTANIDKTNDNYTLALIANALANVNNKEAKRVVNKLLDQVAVNGDAASLTSTVRDYYGSYGDTQTIQTTALTSMALSKLQMSPKTNGMLINYIIKSKDAYGTWRSTQATILALKSLITYSESEGIEKQEITIKVNDEEQKIKIGENPISIYQNIFDQLEKENKIKITLPKGKLYYEIVQEYYVPYETIKTEENKIKVNMQMPDNIKVNEKVEQIIRLENTTNEAIENLMVTIDIPSGFTVIEESLELLKVNGIIEKYETNYRQINVYIRNFTRSEFKDLKVQLRASYPVNIISRRRKSI